MTAIAYGAADDAVAVVTGVGAIIGQGIVTSLRNAASRTRIVGVDRDPDGIGRFWCDDFVAKPACAEGSAEYRDFWGELLRRKEVGLVLPGIEPDVLFFSRNREIFETAGVRLALNEPALIELAQDKWHLNEELLRLGLPAIPSCLSRDWDDCIRRLGPPPLLLKPRRGSGARGIAVLRNEDDFVYWSRRSGDDFLVQRFVGRDDQEFTVGAFGLGDGSGLDPIIFRRRLSPAGSTQYAEVVPAHPHLEDTVRKLSSAFKPIGPTNYQFRMEGDVAYLLEINPRFSSSNSLRTAFGYNEAEMSLSFYLRGRRPRMPSIRQGRGWRYQQDYVVL